MQITVKAMLIVRNDDKLLFSRGFDTVKKEAFLRPLGGHVEFGETGAETIRREMLEEVDCDALNIRFVSVVENIFIYNGKQGHEIILMYEGKLANETLREREKFLFKEGRREVEAGWYSKADVENERLSIYPPFPYF